MKVISIENHQLVVSEADISVIGADEVLIENYAAGVNRADIFQVEGSYLPPKGASLIPGLEVSGIIKAVGSNVKKFKKGDKVCALLEGGGYAEFSVAKATQTFKKPENLDFIEAAALPEALFTVWSNLVINGKLKKAETVLIHGGSSGIGTFAIQLAKQIGARVIATTSNEDKVRKLKKLGADFLINYKLEDFSLKVKEYTNGKGADLIIDIVGGSFINSDLKALSPKGRLIILSFLGGAKAEVNFAPLLMKNLTIIGTTLRSKPAVYKARINKALEKLVLPLVEKKLIVPIIDKSFALKDAAKAHKFMADAHHIGKIILKCK